MTNERRIEVQVDVDAPGEVLTGVMTDVAGTRRRFAGWMQLTQLIDQAWSAARMIPKGGDDDNAG